MYFSKQEKKNLQLVQLNLNFSIIDFGIALAIERNKKVRIFNFKTNQKKSRTFIVV